MGVEYIRACTPPPRTNRNSPRKMIPLSTIVEISNGSTCTTRHRAMLYPIGNKKNKKNKINLQKHQVSDPCSNRGRWMTKDIRNPQFQNSSQQPKFITNPGTTTMMRGPSVWHLQVHRDSRETRQTQKNKTSIHNEP